MKSVRVMDPDGNVIPGAEATVTFAVDAAGPDGYLVLTRSPAIGNAWEALAGSNLCDVSGVSEMRFSLDGKLTWSTWEPYLETAPLTLPAGNGTKTVYAEFRDAASNVAQLNDAITLVPLRVGWTLAAGGPGSDFLGQILFGYDGSTYQSITGQLMAAGTGYWCKATIPDIAYSEVTDAPITCRVQTGWNLIGNTASSPLALPTGMVAFVYTGTSYESTPILQPSEGAWVKLTEEQDVVLLPTG